MTMMDRRGAPEPSASGFIQVFSSMGDRNFVKTLAAGDISAADNEQVILGTHVRVRLS